MGFKTFLVASLVAVSTAYPLLDPIQMIKRAGPAAGVVMQKCSAPGQIALAYDDGPYQYTQKLVDTLNAGGAKGTFFVTGTLYGCIYNHRTALQHAHRSGHQIASHSWSHPSTFGSLSATAITTEMTRLEQSLVNILGVKPTYMRPPYLATTGNVLPTMQKLGYRVVTNDVDSGDWNGLTPAQSEQRFAQAGAAGNGHVSLMHETYASTVDTLTPWLINWAKLNKLKMVTVAECMGDTAAGAYKSGTPNGESTC